MKKLEQHMIALYGEKGRLWIQGLPKRIESIAKEWKLTDLHPVFNLSYNYVMMAMNGNDPVILKFVLLPEELQREVAALQVFSKGPIIQLLRYTDDVMMIERAQPGISLRQYFPTQENSSINVFIQIVKRLHVAGMQSSLLDTSLNSFTPLPQVLAALDNSNLDSIPSLYLTKARELKAHLLTTTQEEVVLHGDLHHSNILNHHDTFKAIDPKGFIGDKWYDMGAFIRNPLKELTALPDALDVIKRRIEMVSAVMHADHKRITQWTFVQCILGWAWSLDDGSSTSPFEKQAKLLYQIV